MKETPTLSRVHREQERARRSAARRSTAQRSTRATTPRAARRAKGRKKGAEPEQLLLFDDREPAKRTFASGKKIGRPRKEGAGLRHEARPVRNPRHPLHVVSRVCPGLESLRTNDAVDLIRGAIRESQGAYGMRVIHYSIQSNHIHLLVEVDGSELQPSLRGVPVNEIRRSEELAKLALAKGIKSLLVKIAKRLNARLWRRKGQVFEGRYYAESISTPLQMQRAIAYVLNNGQHHGATILRIDPYSSGRWFDGWEAPIATPSEPPEEWPVAAPRTWFAGVGWKIHGPIPFAVAA